MRRAENSLSAIILCTPPPRGSRQTQRGRARNTAFFMGGCPQTGNGRRFSGGMQEVVHYGQEKHIPLFDDQLEMLELLTDQEVGQAVLADMRFMRSGTETDLTGGAGVVYQVLRAQFIRNQNDAAVGKKGGRPRKSPAETPVSEAETTERNETEPDGTGQDGTEPDETESDRTGGGDGSAGGRFVPPTLDEVRAYVCRDARRWSPRPSSTFTRPGAGWWERPPCGTGRPPVAVRSPGSAGAGPRPRPRSPTPTA